jgi:hypothetical protein
MEVSDHLHVSAALPESTPVPSQQEAGSTPETSGRFEEGEILGPFLESTSERPYTSRCINYAIPAREYVLRS